MSNLLYGAIFFIFLYVSIPLQGQSIQLKLTVKAEENSTMPGVAVKLNKKEVSNSLFQMTDQNGMAVFKNLTNGAYSLKVSHLGYKTIDSIIELAKVRNDVDIFMEIESVSLGEVSIVGKKPLIRQEDDKMIIDPSPLAGTASNTLEVLESTPGMYVDHEGGIFLNGATPASIYINGREQKMSNQDIQTILRSLPPGSIERIEVMRTPSTKYDASSSGGIINIILKKGVKLGRFGSVNAGFNQGKYSRQSAGITFNNSSTKATSYVNFNFNNYRGYDELTTQRLVNTDTSINQSAYTKVKHFPLILGYGFNYEFNPKLSFTYDGRINFTDRNSDSENNNTVQSLDVPVLSNSNNLSVSKSDVWNIQQDFGLFIKFDTSGSELVNKFSFTFFDNKSDQNYDLELLHPISSIFSGFGNNGQNRFHFILESDLTYKIMWDIKLETGLKSSFQKFKSKSDYYISAGGNDYKDTGKTNSYRYLENINAGYIQLSREIFAGLNLKTGIRLENTLMQGSQTIPSDTSFVVNRIDLFPYIYLSRRLFKIMGAELFTYLIYRKTISRPGYQELNPYAKFIDQYLYESGNPSLMPQFTDNVEFNVSFNDIPVFAIGRNITKDIFSTVMYNDKNIPNVLVRTYDNVGKNKETYLRGIVGIPPGSRYFFAFGAQYNYNEYDGIYENKPWQFSNGSWRFFTFHSLSLTKDLKFSLTGFIMTKGQWNFYEMKNFGQLNVGLTQTLLNKKLTITLNARDILKTMDTEFLYNQGTIKSSGKRISDTRWIGMNVRYNFGINKKEDKKSVPAFDVPEF